MEVKEGPAVRVLKLEEHEEIFPFVNFVRFVIFVLKSDQRVQSEAIVFDPDPDFDFDFDEMRVKLYSRGTPEANGSALRPGSVRQCPGPRSSTRCRT